MTNKKSKIKKPKKSIEQIDIDVKKLKSIGKKFLKAAEESKSEGQAAELKKKARSCILRIEQLKEMKEKIKNVN